MLLQNLLKGFSNNKLILVVFKDYYSLYLTIFDNKQILQLLT